MTLQQDAPSEPVQVVPSRPTRGPNRTWRLGTGRVNGIGERQSGFMGFVRNLHRCALSCEGYPAYIPFLAKPAPVLGNEELTVGGLVLAVVGLILIFVCISGIVIWWPGIRRWRRGFQVRRRKGTYKLNYDLHNVVGIAVLPLLLMWAISGAGFELEQVRDAWYAVLPGEKPPEHEDLVSKPGSGEIGIDRAEQIALAKVPGARAVSVSVPDKETEDSAYLVYVASGTDPYDHGTWPGNVGGSTARVPPARARRHRRHDVVDAPPEAQAEAA